MRARFLQFVWMVGFCLAGAFAQAAEIRTCFTPGQDCTGMIVDQVDRATARVLVQAYGMTSEPIMQALAQAKRRGVDVRVLLDKSNEQERYSAATFLINQGIAVLIDHRVVKRLQTDTDSASHVTLSEETRPAPPMRRRR